MTTVKYEKLNFLFIFCFSLLWIPKNLRACCKHLPYLPPWQILLGKPVEYRCLLRIRHNLFLFPTIFGPHRQKRHLGLDRMQKKLFISYHLILLESFICKKYYHLVKHLSFLQDCWGGPDWWDGPDWCGGETGGEKVTTSVSFAGC